MIGIIYNPTTNKGASVERMKKIREELDRRGVQYEYRESTYAGETSVIANELADICDTLVSAGGDGTFAETVNGSIDKDVRYAILPFGSGNDSSRMFNLVKKTDMELVDIITGDNFAPFDCETINDEYISIQFAAFGIVPEVLANFTKMKKSKGLNYVKALLGAVIRHKPKTYKFIVDGKEEEYLSDMLAVMNVKTAGGGLNACPIADSSDRQLDLIMIRRTSKIRYYLNLLALARGKLTSQPNIIHMNVTEAELVAATVEDCVIDGEMRHYERIKVTLHPKQIFVKQ